MAQLAIGIAGAAIGSFFGPLGASIGFQLGSALGGALFGPKGPDGPRLTDLKLQSSQYGAPIPIVWGKQRLAFVIIDQTDLEEHEHHSSGKGSDGPSTFSYTATFAVCICEGPIVGVLRMWADGRLLYDVTGATDVDNSAVPVTFYLGTEDQLPDPTFEAIHGVGNVSAYRGYAYAVFGPSMEMADYFNRIANWEFEVFTKGGTIPWRVNTISNPMSTQWWTSDTITFGRSDGVSYDPDTGVVTAFSYGSINIEYAERTWDTVRTSATPNDLGETTFAPVTAFPAGGSPRSQGGPNICSNAPLCWCFSSSDASLGCWYSKGTPVGAILDTSSGTGPDGSPAFQACYGGAIYANDFVYATYGATGTGYSGVARWPAPGAIPTGLFDAVYRVAGISSPTALSLCPADNGDIWVSLGDAAGAHGSDLFHLDAELNEIYKWDHSDAAHSTPSTFRIAGDFVVYHGYIAFSTGTGIPSVRQFDVWSINADHTFTHVGNLTQWGGPNTRLINGLVLGRDGVVSLDPPVSKIALYEIVGGGGSVAGISERMGLDSTQYDASELVDLVTGFKLAQQGTGRAAVETLQPAYFFDALERDVVVAFPKRGGGPVFEMTAEDLAAYEDGSEPPGELRPYTHGHDDDLPRQVTAVFQDEDADYQPGAQPAQRRVGNSASPMNIQLPIAMTNTQGYNIAEINLLQAHVERDSYGAATSRKFLFNEPTDVGIVIDRLVRLTEKDESPSGLITWKGKPSVPQIYIPTGTGASGGGFRQTTARPSQLSQLAMFDLPLNNDDDFANGPYAGMAGASSSSWRGATLYKSSDAGSSYAGGESETTAQVMGTALNVLGDWQGGFVWDEVNYLDVLVGAGGGTLASATKSAVRAGANGAVVGLEIIHWRDATLIAPSTYRLTGLLRGQRGTEFLTPAHAVGDIFAAFPLMDVNGSLGEIHASRLYKPVTDGTSVASATAVAFTNNGAALRCYAPAHLYGGADGSGDITLRWMRRTRKGGAWVGGATIPLSEASEQYVVQIWDLSYALCARIIVVDDIEEAAYSDADQVTDFGVEQSMYGWTVGQVGQLGLGVQARGVAIGIGATTNAPLSPITPYSYNPITAGPPTSSPAVDATLSWPSDQIAPFAMVIGHRYVIQFTTGGATPSGQHFSVAEYGTPQRFRRLVIATDPAGTAPVTNGIGYGNTASVIFGSGLGQCPIAASTTYYALIDAVFPDGSFSGAPGTDCTGVIAIN